MVLLSPRIATFQRFGGRGRERGGILLPSGESGVSLFAKYFLARSVSFGNRHGYCPLTLALSPNTENVLGERVERVGTLTQGGARGDGGPEAPASRLPWA